MGKSTSRLKSRLNNEKGSYSIIAVMLIFIILIAVAAYTDMITKRWTINEVQAVMDLSGGNTLKKHVNLNELYQEKIGDGRFTSDKNKEQIKSELEAAVDEDYLRKIEDAYKEELFNQIKVNDTISSVQVTNLDVDFGYTNEGLGEKATPRPQFVIDSVVQLEVKTSNQFDTGANYTSQVFSSFNSSNFEVTVIDKPKDGKQTLAVRSVTRLVYR
nr:hypothetical protein [Jeotgalibacillus malaysiensis]